MLSPVLTAHRSIDSTGGRQLFFDTHLHLVNRNRLRYPWLKDVPALDRDWSYEDYEVIAQRVGISDVLHMEVDVHEDDINKETAFVAELMNLPGTLVRGAISGARPESEAFAAWLEAVDRRVVKGVRRVLHTQPDELSQQPLFRENIRRLGEAGLPFDACVLARQLSLAIALADVAQDTVFVIDHCGVPDIAGNEFDSWANDIYRLAKRPNVNIKLSGITAYGSPDWTIQSLRRWVDHVLERFGPERVVWGSDSPVCTLQSNLAEWVAASQVLISEYTSDEQDAIRRKNAQRLWM